LIFAMALAALGAAGCLGPTAGTVELAGLDKPAEKPLAFPAGKKLEFPVHAESYDYTGKNWVVIDVTLLRAGAKVATMSCKGFELEGDAGSGSSVTNSNSDCTLTVPPGGSDAIRAVATLQDKSGKASFQGLAIYIRD
jgi:hypothetical protein